MKCYVSFHYRSVCQFLAKINYLAFFLQCTRILLTYVGLIYTFDLIKARQSPAIFCTSLPQQWHKPRGSKMKGVPISSIVIVKARRERKRRPIDCCYLLVFILLKYHTAAQGLTETSLLALSHKLWLANVS